jgi:poly(3-hydroxybutyrate) depolymerase
MSAFAAMRGQDATGFPPSRLKGEVGPRLIVFHGTDDATVDSSNAGRIMARHGGTGRISRSVQPPVDGTRGYTTVRREGANGVVAECWMVGGAQHAWSGGSPRGSYTDPEGPDASRAMVRFFLGAAIEG